MFQNKNMNYFNEKISTNLLNIYKHRGIAYLANGFFGVFSVFFLYKMLGNSVQNLALIFTVTSAGYILLMPFLTKLVNKIGFKNLILLGWFINIFIMSLYFLLANFQNNYILFILIVMPIFFRVTYWVPYHTLMAESSTKKDRTKTLSFLGVMYTFVGIFMPIFAGYISVTFGYSFLFGFGVLFSVVAFFPLLKIKDSGEKITWKISKFWKKYFKPDDKKFALAVFARGLETSVGIIVWPIFIFQLLKGNLLDIGLLSGLITLFVMIINLIQGKISDSKNYKKKFVKYGSWFYAFGWFLKIFGTTALYIFIVDVYHRVSSIFSFNSFDALVYDHIADSGHLMDENTLLKEMTLHTGKVTGFVFIAIFSNFIDLNYLFFIAITGTLFLNFISSPEVLEKI